MNRTTRRAFEQAADILNAAFEQAGPFPDQEATPPLLADEIRKCLDICQQAGTAEVPMPPEEIDELGTHALECLSDLGLWAYQLKLDDARATIENVALDVAQWIAQYSGRIEVLEQVVNALARQADATQDTAKLATLFDRAHSIIAGAAPGPENATGAAAMQPWLTLHFNCAIIATRTRQPRLMNAAFDLLETHFPQQCADFYEEGLRQSAKPVYGDPVREIMRERIAKWTSRR